MQSLPSDADGVTGQLCTWIADIQLTDIPEVAQTRIKYLILDGLACALHGAHLPWSEVAVKGVLDMEGEGWCDLIGRKEVRLEKSSRSRPEDNSVMMKRL